MNRANLRLLALVFSLVLVCNSWRVARADESLNAIADDVTRLESLRQVKDVQRSYAQLANAGSWNDMAALFTSDASFSSGAEKIAGRARIAAWLRERGGGRQGLPPGALHAEYIDEPLVNLAADGRSAKARWMGLLFTGDGHGQTHIESGIYENEYRLEDGSWKISSVSYHPQFSGDHAQGFRNEGGEDLPAVPFHFTADEAGRPLVPAVTPPRSSASLAQLEARVAALNDEDAVRNLQNAYGYYVDQRMWDDVVDLFSADAVIDIAGAGRFRGADGVRSAMLRMGPAGLAYGQLNDHPLFDVMVRVERSQAWSRGLQLGLVGDANAGTAHWEFAVFRNHFVKQGGVWRVQEMQIVPVLEADYATGWGQVQANAQRPPQLLSLQRRTSAGSAPASTSANTSASGDAAQRLQELRRRLARSQAWDGSENITSAYGYHIDYTLSELADLFAEQGNKLSPGAGYYIGREHIRQWALATWPPPLPAARASTLFHWRIQPVILVAEDGRSANVRVRMFEPRTTKRETDPGAGFFSGIYPNDQTVLENGSWKIWAFQGDEPTVSSAGWKGGWSGVKPRAARPAQAAPVQAASASSPAPAVVRQRAPIPTPDVPLSATGRRSEHYRGGTGEPRDWPEILPVWFAYRNPVSGREPALFWPDCGPCEAHPELKLTSHGYLMPPNGPAPAR